MAMILSILQVQNLISGIICNQQQLYFPKFKYALKLFIKSNSQEFQHLRKLFDGIMDEVFLSDTSI